MLHFSLPKNNGNILCCYSAFLFFTWIMYIWDGNAHLQATFSLVACMHAGYFQKMLHYSESDENFQKQYIIIFRVMYHYHYSNVLLLPEWLMQAIYYCCAKFLLIFSALFLYIKYRRPLVWNLVMSKIFEFLLVLNKFVS